MSPPRRLRVAITIGPAGPGGTATYARELTDALARRDDVDLVVVGSDDARSELRQPVADHVSVPRLRLAEQTAVAALGPVLSRRGVDIVHGTRQLVPLFVSPPRVLTFHDDYAFTRRSDYDIIKRLLLPPIFRRSLAVANAVLTLSDDVAAVARGYVGDTTPVVDAGAAVSSALAGAAVGPSIVPEPYALVVGDAGPRKRVGWLLDRWEAVEATTGLSLVVAGGRAADAELSMRLERSTVVFRRLPDDDELATLYTHATMVIDASTTEGFGFPHVEAAHFGAPYIALRTDDDPLTAIAAALADDPADADAVRSPTTWDEVADRTVALYHRVLDAS